MIVVFKCLGCSYTSTKSCMSVSLFIASFSNRNYVNSRYRQFWMSSVSQIFWRHSWDVSTLVSNNFHISCISVSLIIASLPYWNWSIFGYLQFGMRYIFQSFWKHSWEFCTLNKNNFGFLVCVLVTASLPYRYYINSGYLQFWMSYLSKLFWTYFLDVCRVVPNDLVFLVCLSVCSLPQCLDDIMLTMDISSSGWPILHKFHWDIPELLAH